MDGCFNEHGAQATSGFGRPRTNRARRQRAHERAAPSAQDEPGARSPLGLRAAAGAGIASLRRLLWAVLGIVPLAASACGLFGLPGLPGGSSGPSVASVSPRLGPQSGGQQVVLTGSGFEGTTAVWFGSTPAPSFTVVSDTELVATTPPSSSPAGVVVRVKTTAGTSPADCMTILFGCKDAYFYSTTTPWRLSVPVNVTGATVPLAGPAGLSVNATGGTLAVTGSMQSSYDYFFPVAYEASGTVSVANLLVRIAGQVGTTVEVPLPVGLPYGLDLYVRISPSVTEPLPVQFVVNASWTFSLGWVNGAPAPMASSLACGPPTSGGAPAGNATIAACFDPALEEPTLDGADAALDVSPVWLQVGPPQFNTGVGPTVGLSAGLASNGASYAEICASLQWAVQALFYSHTANLLGPWQVWSTGAGDGPAHCTLGTVS
jgi:hypothetical protein